MARCCALIALCSGFLLMWADLQGGAYAEAPPALELALLAPSEMRMGERYTLAVTLHVPEGTQEPLLLTPSAEGEAVELARGRLMRRDARGAEPRALVFELPVTAKDVGPSVLRVHARTFVCEREVCRPVEAEAAVHVVVVSR